jgi:hypothetical protein
MLYLPFSERREMGGLWDLKPRFQSVNDVLCSSAVKAGNPLANPRYFVAL